MLAKVGRMSRPLDEFPRPNLAVDLALFTLTRDTDDRRPTLGVVVLEPPEHPLTLPGRFVREGQRVTEAVDHALEQKLGHRPRRLDLRMLGVYDDPSRDPRGWVVSLAWSAAMPEHDLARLTPEATVLSVRGEASRGRRVTRVPLAYDHDEMVTTGLRRMRRRYERLPDPDGLLRAPYTLSRLRHAHEAVLDEPLKRDTFNRRMREFLEPVVDKAGNEVLSQESVGRPAQVFRPLRQAQGSGPFPLPRADR